MKRLALLVVTAAALVLAGCEKKTAQPQTHVEEPAKPLDQMETTAAPDTYGTESAAPGRPMDQPPAAATGSPRKPSDEVLTPGAGGGRTYVVQKGDTLYGLARKFYGDGSKWRVIWEANKARVPNKDQLPVGTKLIIP